MLKKCEVCGKEFEAKSNAICCSNNCYGKKWREDHPTEKAKEIGKCIVCGSEFEKKRSDHICCSKKCRNRYNSKQSKERVAKHKEKKKQEMMREAVRMSKKGENHHKIADIAIEARKHGMTYGQYVAKMGI